MINFEIGTKLYACRKYHVFVFPTEKACAWPMREEIGAVFCLSTELSTEPMDLGYAERYAAWLSSKLDCHAGWIASGVPWMVVKVGGLDKINGYRRVQVVSVDGKFGWINVVDWMNIKELAA